MSDINLNLLPEKFLNKLVETVTDRGIGMLFPIWHLRREAKAKAEVKGDEMRILAQAEQDVEAIRKGELRIESTTKLRLIKSASAEAGYPATRVEPVLDLAELSRVADKIEISDRLAREINVTKALACAARIAAEDLSEPSAEKVDSDWLDRWRDYAGSVSHEQLQLLWGKLLAGEVKSPRSFSLRTLDFIRNLSTQEAELVSRVAARVPAAAESLFLPLHFSLRAWGVGDEDLVELQTLGLLAGAPKGIEHNLRLDRGEILSFDFGGRAITATAMRPSSSLPLYALPLSRTMRDLLSLCVAKVDEEFLKSYATAFARFGLHVTIADTTVEPDGTTKILRNLAVIFDPDSPSRHLQENENTPPIPK